MIEMLLQAERALTTGMVDQAERLYRKAADSDPRNSIAVVGLARVALERADDAQAWRETRRALAIDPENVAASRLAARLEEVFAYRGEALPAMEPVTESGPTHEPGPNVPAPKDVALPADFAIAVFVPAPEPAVVPAPEPAVVPTPQPAPQPAVVPAPMSSPMPVPSPMPAPVPVRLNASPPIARDTPAPPAPPRGARRRSVVGRLFRRIRP